MAPSAPLPENEADRLKALQRLNVLDTKIETRFERIVYMARKRFNVPVTLISLVDEERQWFKSHQGFPFCETPRSSSFCAYAILEDGLFIVSDAQIDPRFFDNPLVTGEPYIRFYAAYTLKDKDGYKLGTFCIIDTKPRTLSKEEREKLREMGEFVEYELNRQLTPETALQDDQS